MTSDSVSARRAALPAFPVAVTINIDVEWGDLIAAGAGKGGAGLFGRYSYGRYGLREGFWRLIEMLRATQVPATFFVAAADAERHPDMIRAILADGHEIAALGRILKTPEESGDGDLETIRHAKATFEKLGVAVKGWRSSNGLITPKALRLLAELGFTYDSDFENDDFPYLFDDGAGGRLAELPVFGYLTDATFYGAFHGPERVRKVWMEEFDALYSVGGYVNLTLNQHGDYGSARAVRVDVAAEVIEQIRKRPGAAFLRCDQIADRLLKARACPGEAFPDDLPSPITL